MGDATTISRTALLQYGMLALPLAFAGMPLYVHAPDYYATQFGLSLGSMGIALLVLRIIDAVQDPLIGQLSGRFAQYRQRVIVISALLLALTFTLLFQPVKELALFWFASFMFLATTAFSVLSINLNTLGGLWSRDSHQQTCITSTREAFGLIGLLLAVLLPSALSQIMPAPEAFALVSALLVLLVVVALTCFYRWSNARHMTEYTEEAGDASRLSYVGLLKHMPPQTRHFFGIYALSMLASAIPAVLVLFYIRDRLEAEALTGLFLLLYFVAGAAGMPLWQKLSRPYDTTRSWVLAMLLAIVSFMWAYFLQAGDIWQYGIICILSGIAFGADLSLPPALLADHIHQQEAENSASMQFGLLAFLAKTALALGSALSLSLLDIAGFQAGQTNNSEALQMLSLTYAAIPCVIKLIAAIWLWRAFPLQTIGDSHEQENHNPHHRSSHHANELH